VAFIEQNLAEAQNFASILNIERRIIGYKEGPLNLYHPKREFVREGIWTEVKQKMLSTKSSKRTIFLFNDLIIFTKAMAKGNKYLFQFKVEEVTLHNVSKLNFDLICNEDIHHFQATTHEEKAKWFYEIKELIDTRTRKRVFGQTLDSILKEELELGFPITAGIPLLVDYCIKKVQAKGIQAEGIFRLSPSMIDLKKAKDVIEKGNILDLQWDKIHVNVAATLLKLFFRELGEPLVPYECYDRFLSVQRQYQQQTTVKQAKLSLVQPIFQLLPPANVQLLVFLIKFLLQVASFSSQNRMDLSNLSIIFGQTLIRPRIETIESSVEIPYVNSIFQLAIENYEFLFPTTK